MRISDWSADVCSSDLEEKDNQVEGPEIAPSQLLQRLALHEHVGVGEYVERFPHIAHGTGQAVKNIETSYQDSPQPRSSASRAPLAVPADSTGRRSGCHFGCGPGVHQNPLARPASRRPAPEP